jgi:hypothetical protein
LSFANIAHYDAIFDPPGGLFVKFTPKIGKPASIVTLPAQKITFAMDSRDSTGAQHLPGFEDLEPVIVIKSIVFPFQGSLQKRQIPKGFLVAVELAAEFYFILGLGKKHIQPRSLNWSNVFRPGKLDYLSFSYFAF